MILLTQLINMLSFVLIILVFVSILLSYFMDPYHPVRQGGDNLIKPLLDPIRKLMPPIGGFDFSPLVLIILIEVISNLLIQFLNAIS
jgi:YggT family protein